MRDHSATLACCSGFFFFVDIAFTCSAYSLFNGFSVRASVYPQVVHRLYNFTVRKKRRTSRLSMQQRCLSQAATVKCVGICFPFVFKNRFAIRLCTSKTEQIRNELLRIDG